MGCEERDRTSNCPKALRLARVRFSPRLIVSWTLSDNQSSANIAVLPKWRNSCLGLPKPTLHRYVLSPSEIKTVLRAHLCCCGA